MNKFIQYFKPVLLGMILLFAVSCSKDDYEKQAIEEQTVTSSEVQTILNVDSQSRVVDDIINNLFQNGQSGKSSKKEECYVAEYSDTGYSVTFDNCSLEGTENISGSISVTYKEGEEESAYTATYTNLSVGGMVINGTRAFTIMNTGEEDENFVFDIVSDITIKLADGAVIEESGAKNFSLVLDAENFENTTFEIAGNWTVKSDGNTYIINITTPLSINIFSCDYITTGIMSLNKNGLGVTVDFGNGTCDAIATATYPDGTMEDISLDE